MSVLARRHFLLGALALPFASLAQSPAEAKRTRLVLLGTKGGPRVSPAQLPKNPSTLILANGVPYVVDCGYGTSTQLVTFGVQLNRLRHLFITHHHSDHNLELGPLARMRDAFFEYMKFDIETRMADEGRPDLRKLVVAHDFDKPGVVLQNDDVRISCALVRHPPITQAYAYRFDAKDRSIVVSGDTAYAPELAEFAKGADVLVHEVMHLGGLEALLKRVPNAATLREHLLASHTLPEDVGRVAAAAGVKTLVLSHFVPGDDPSITDEMWAEGVRKHYGGRIVVGKDLMEIS